jgi:very-short-patch-repair endonuclease
MQPVTVELKTQRGEVLVALMNNHADFVIARDQHWYRIPISSVNKLLKNRWPPRWLAFYQTKIFGPEAYAIHYYAQVVNIKSVYRWELFPNLPRDKKSNQRYYQLLIEPLQRLSQPILSRRLRRVLFIPTTWQKFLHAIEINDLYGGSPQGDHLWAEFKRLQIQADRQELVKIKRQDYALDFAIYCPKGKIDVETDGDTWYVHPEKAAQNNRRDNALESAGWNVLRFNTAQVQEEMAEYCVPTIAETINKLGGVEEGRVLPRKIDLDESGGSQKGLFD